MEGAGVEESRRGRAEAAALVETVESDGLIFAVGFLGEEKAHGDAHPEELGRLEAAGGFDRFVNDEVAIVNGLDAEEVEFEVGGGVELGGERVEVVFLKAGGVALNGNAMGDGFFEGVDVEGFELGNTVTDDVPAEDFFVDVGELDAAGELGEVGVLLDQGFRVEDDGLVEVLLRDLVEDGTGELGLDLLGGEAELEADGGELDAEAKILAIPEGGGAVGLLDHDHGGLGCGGRGGSTCGGVLGVGERVGGVGVGAGFVAGGAVEDVGLGNLKVARLHELFLHHILNFLDVDEGLFRGENAGGDGLGDG